MKILKYCLSCCLLQDLLFFYYDNGKLMKNLLFYLLDALQQGASQFEQQAGKLKRKFWLKNLKVNYHLFSWKKQIDIDFYLVDDDHYGSDWSYSHHHYRG